MTFTDQVLQILHLRLVGADEVINCHAVVNVDVEARVEAPVPIPSGIKNRRIRNSDIAECQSVGVRGALGSMELGLKSGTDITAEVRSRLQARS